MTIFRTDGIPKRGSGEKASAISVHARNRPSGMEMRGQRSGNPESRRIATASASRIVEIATRRIAMAEAQASHNARRFRKGGGTNI